MRTNIKGDIGELLVMTKLLKEGYWVSKPFGDDAPYDIIADDKHGKLIRIQVKYSTPKNGTLRTHLTCSEGHYKDLYVDWIIVIDAQTEEMYKIDLKDVGEELDCIIRVSPTKNGQNKGVKLAENYLMH